MRITPDESIGLWVPQGVYRKIRQKLGELVKRLQAVRSATRLSAAPGEAAAKPYFVRAYVEHTKRLLESWGSREGALQAAVGSATPEDYEMIGKLEKALLIYAGLRPDDTLVDIGCGSGRLAVQLSGWLEGHYLGTDVVQALLDHATHASASPDWRFERVSGLTVPTGSDSVDMACAFSVFTHLRHEESYVYMRDIHRVLKPGGRLVFTFLEFAVPALWAVMEGNIASIGKEAVLNQFMSLDAVEAFAQHLGFELVEVHRSEDPFFPVMDQSAAGNLRNEFHSLGQSVAIYRKPG